jgi:ribosomal protein S18 acetylase RimI-like enzyme
MQTARLELSLGISLRSARASDAGFLAGLHHSRRDDLRCIDGDRDLIEMLIEDQQRYQTLGYGANFPNAAEFIVEKVGEPIGRVVVDFGPNEVRVLDIGLIRSALGKGCGTSVLRALQAAAAKVPAPLTLSVLWSNPRAKKIYSSLGFTVTESRGGVDFMVWYPPASQMSRHFG